MKLNELLVELTNERIKITEKGKNDFGVLKKLLKNIEKKESNDKRQQIISELLILICQKGIRGTELGEEIKKKLKELDYEHMKGLEDLKDLFSI